MDLQQLNNHIQRLTQKIQTLSTEREKYKKQRNKYKNEKNKEVEQKNELEAISQILGEKLTAEKKKNEELFKKLNNYKEDKFPDLNYTYKMVLKGHLSESSCPICLDKFSEKFEDTSKMTLLSDCSHCYCTECINKWEKEECPQCKCKHNKKISIV